MFLEGSEVLIWGVGCPPVAMIVSKFIQRFIRHGAQQAVDDPAARRFCRMKGW